MTLFKPKDPEYEARVRASFAEQRVMQLIGARLVRVEPGLVDVELGFRDDLTQQDRYIHAGIITTIADTACGYAAYSLMPAGSRVLSVEFKVNLLRPAAGLKVVAEAKVIKAGATLTVAQCDVYGHGDDDTKIIATMLGTMICR